MKKAMFFHNDGLEVVCGLCMHRCQILPGRRGLCGVRENQDGTLVSLIYGKISAEQIDPVEKKPLFHFLPGTLTYSISTSGCNFRCLHCQNHSLSQVGPKDQPVPYVKKSPEQIARAALNGGCKSISYTYVEPTVFFEFAYDCAELAHRQGLKNVFVSNGYMSPEAASALAEVIDGINIDIKSFSEEFYNSTCGGSLQKLATIR